VDAWCGGGRCGHIAPLRGESIGIEFDLGCRVQGRGESIGIEFDLGCRVQGRGESIGIEFDLGCRVQGTGCRVYVRGAGFGFRFEGQELGFWVD